MDENFMGKLRRFGVVVMREYAEEIRGVRNRGRR